MSAREALMEVLRWGFVTIPAALYYYAGELDLDSEDLGILGAMFYTYTHRSKPLLRRGLEIGQVMQCYPSLSKSKLAWRLSKWARLGLVEVEESSLGREFPARRVFLEPLLSKLEEMISRDHPEIDDLEYRRDCILKPEANYNADQARRGEGPPENPDTARKIRRSPCGTHYQGPEEGFKKVVDFVEQKTGNLVSPDMRGAIKHWLDEFGCKPEYLIIMLELCFERGIYDPREINSIARGLWELSASNLGSIEDYFQNVVDKPGYLRSRRCEFAREMAELGSFIGIDMQAEARKNTYEKWRYEWGFSHEMIMKAGEIMCQRTRNGGLEYMDRVLDNWRGKGIFTVEEVERDSNEYRNRTRKRDGRFNLVKNGTGSKEEVEIFVAPHVLEELKSKA